MKVIINKILPFGKRFYAINLCGILFAKGPCDETVINHESIHTRQILELLILGFYLWYVAEWLVKSVLYRSTFAGYKNISFEREAYANERNLNYLSGRGAYSFIKYLRRF